MKPVEFTRVSRKHRVGRASARYVMATTEPVESTHVGTRARRRTWTGEDERRRELEIVAIERPDCWLVNHVMPTRYRRSEP